MSFWKSAAILLLATSLAIPGCTSAPKTDSIPPGACTPAPFPNLPQIDAQKLYEAVGPEMYWKLMRREKRIVDWALENEALLISLCGEPEVTDGE